MKLEANEISKNAAPLYHRGMSAEHGLTAHALLCKLGSPNRRHPCPQDQLSEIDFASIEGSEETSRATPLFDGFDRRKSANAVLFRVTKGGRPCRKNWINEGGIRASAKSGADSKG